MLGATLIALALQAGPAAAAPNTIQPISPTGHPNWLRRPTSDASDRSYPPKAVKYGVAGSATLRCQVNRDGFLNNCQVRKESPVGYGFAEAAIMLSRTMVMTPGYRDVVGIPLNWAPVRGMYRTMGSDLGHLTRPQFLSAPDQNEVEVAYPKDGGGVNGYAVLNCNVLRFNGHFGRCSSVFEQPVGRGFGKAALSLASKFEVKVPDLEKRDALAIWLEFPVRLPAPRADKTTALEILDPIWLTESEPAVAPEAGGPPGSYGFANCAAQKDGTLTGCQADTGPGSGLADAAATAAAGRRMSVWTGDGQSVEGARVEVRIALGPEVSQTDADDLLSGPH